MSKILQPDLCVIGAGSGGLSVAAGAAQMGVDTVLIEKDKMGGDCLNTGCVPSKSLLAAAKSAHNTRAARKFGIHAGDPAINFEEIHDHVHDVIAQIEPHDSVERFEGLGVNVIQGEGRFVEPNTLEVNGITIKPRYFVIATGSRAFVPPIEGLDNVPYLTNESIFEQTELPKDLIVIGGGPIGLEMAQAHARLGSNVTVIEMATILPRDDQELVDIIRECLMNDKIKLMENSGVEKVEQSGDSITVTVKTENDRQTVTGSHILVATGRTPNTENLNLDAAGIDTERGFIKTDAGLRSTNRKAFAIGDCSGGPQFTHVAGYHATIVIQRALFKIPAKVNYNALPWVTYTDPELAHVGLNETSAIEKYGAEVVQSLSWALEENDRAKAERKLDGKIKIVLGKRGRILGASIVAPNAGDLIQPWILAISKKMKIGAMAGIIAPYPTMGEINKHAAGSYYKPKLFSPFTMKLVNILKRLPF